MNWISFKENSLESLTSTKMDSRGNWSNLATAWGNWDKEEWPLCLRAHISISSLGFITISSTQTRELVPQEKLKSCYNGNLYIISPYLDAIITTGFGFRSTHIILKYYILALFLVAVAWKNQSLMNKWGFYKLYSLQRIWCTHGNSHKSNFLLTFPGSTILCSTEHWCQILTKSRSSHKNNF